MTNYTGSKKINALFFLGCLLFSACSNILETPNYHIYKSIPPGKGRVMVKIEGVSGVRTLLPTDIPSFSQYELEFTTPEKPSVSRTILSKEDMKALTSDGYAVVLDSGVYSLKVTAFVSNGAEHIPAAQNTISVEVIGGILTQHTITVNPIPIAQGGEGFFFWNLNLKDSVGAYTGTLTLTKEGETEALLSKTFPTDDLSGTVKAAAGYYVMILELTNAAQKTARRVEVVHIYPGFTTRAEFNFSNTDFVTQKYLGGTLSMADFKGDVVSTVMVRAYNSNDFRTVLDTGTVDADGNWKVRVPVDYNDDVEYLAIVTTDGGTYTLKLGSASAIGDGGKSDIDLAAVYKPVTTWGELNEALDRIPPASTEFKAGGESVLVIGGSFTVPAGSQTINLEDNRTITLQADSIAARTITRAAGMTGALFTIPTGGSLTLGDSARLLTLDGGSATTAVALVGVNGGDLIMKSNALITNKTSITTNYGIRVETGKFTMFGNAKVAANSPVYLAENRTITLGGNLTQEFAATIVLPSGSTGVPQILKGAPDISISDNYKKFSIFCNGSSVNLNPDGTVTVPGGVTKVLLVHSHIGNIITLTTDPTGGSIFYSTDDTDPTVHYDPDRNIEITRNGTKIRAVARLTGYTESDPFDQVFNYIDPTLYIVADIESTQNVNTNTITLFTPTPEASIKYSTDGSTTNLTLDYNLDTKIVITKDTTINAMATRPGYESSKLFTKEFTWTDNRSQVLIQDTKIGNTITLTTEPPGGNIFYSTNEDAPETSYPTGGIVIPTGRSITIKAIASLDGYKNSNPFEKTFTWTNPSSTVSAPTAEQRINVITLKSDTDGASIYYTINGLDPTPADSLYSDLESIVLNGDATIKALATKQGFNNSSILIKDVVLPRVLGITGSQEGNIITLSTKTPNASISYSTDGLTFKPYSAGGITIPTGKTTISAKATAYGYNDSIPFSKEFTFTPGGEIVKGTYSIKVSFENAKDISTDFPVVLEDHPWQNPFSLHIDVLDGVGVAGYQWYLDGSLVEGSTSDTLTIVAKKLSLASHRVTVIIKTTTGVTYSKSVSFKVK